MPTELIKHNSGNAEYEKLRAHYATRFDRLSMKGCIWNLNMTEDYYLKLFKKWRV